MVNQEKKIVTDKSGKIKAEINPGDVEFELTELLSTSDGFRFAITIPESVIQPFNPRNNPRDDFQIENLQAFLKHNHYDLTSNNNGLFNGNFFGSLGAPIIVNNHQSITTEQQGNENDVPAHGGPTVINNNIFISNGGPIPNNNGYYVASSNNNQGFMGNAAKNFFDNFKCRSVPYHCPYKNPNNSSNNCWCMECLHKDRLAGLQGNNLALPNNNFNNLYNEEVIPMIENFRRAHFNNNNIDGNNQGNFEGLPNRAFDLNFPCADFECFGRYVAMVLRSMPLGRAMICQRNINDILIEEQLSDQEEE